jgi:hypothetical protein
MVRCMNTFYTLLLIKLNTVFYFLGNSRWVYYQYLSCGAWYSQNSLHTCWARKFLRWQKLQMILGSSVQWMITMFHVVNTSGALHCYDIIIVWL